MKKFFKILLFVLLGLLIIGTFVFLWKKSKVKEVEYEVVKMEVLNIEKLTIITGTVQPRNEVELKPQISGIITALYKESGDLVKSGDVIAKVQVIPDISQLNSAESQLKLAEINLEKAKNDFDRSSQLFKSGVVSKESYDNSGSAYKTAKEEVDNAKENIEIIKEGISKNTAKYSNTLIRATISGMILDIPVKVGNSVIQSNNFNDGTTIATIANMNDLIFKGNVDETEVGRIAVGNDVKLMIGAMQDAKMDATLEYIAPKGTVENGATLFEIRAAVKKTNNANVGFIRSGYSANGEIVTAKIENVYSLPESSIEFSGDSAFVYIVNKDKKAKEKYIKTPVVLGLSDGINVQIITGVKKDNEVRGKVKMDEKMKKAAKME
jgi:HlyD family secretion protein